MHSEYFDDAFLFGQDTVDFTEEESPSMKTDDELRALFEGNLNVLRNQSKVAQVLFGELAEKEENPELTKRKYLRNFIVDLILRKNIRGNNLRHIIRANFDGQFLNQNKSTVQGLLNFEYLLGNVFLDLGGYSSCHPIKETIQKSAAKYVLPCKRCAQDQNNGICGKSGKQVVSSVSAIDFQAFANERGFGKIASSSELSKKIKESQEAVSEFKVNKAPHLPGEGIEARKSAESFEEVLADAKADVSKLNWDQFKAQASQKNPKVLLPAFIKGNIKKSTLDFVRMFAGCDLRDIAPYRKFMKYIADRYHQDYSVFMNEVEDFFDLHHIERRVPTLEEARAHDRLVRTKEQEQWDQKLYSNLHQLTWDGMKEAYPQVRKAKLLDFYITARLKHNSLDLNQMFANADLQEVRTHLSKTHKKVLSRFPQYSQMFDHSVSDSILEVGKKTAFVPVDTEATRHFGQDSLEGVKNACGVNESEVKSRFITGLKEKNIDALAYFLSKNEIRSAQIIEMGKEIVASYPTLKPALNQLLESFGITNETFHRFLRNSIKRAKTKVDGEQLYNQVFSKNGKSVQQEDQEEEAPFDFASFETDGVQFD